MQADHGLPLPEYPRPMLARREWCNLNGVWEYAILPARGPLVTQPLPLDYDGTIVVPFAIETAASSVARPLSPDETLYYRRKVERPPGWDGRIALNFEAVDYECAVFVNGSLAAEHVGGYWPFSLPLAGSGPWEVVVAIRDPSDEGDQQHGKQSLNPTGIWYTATSGIWQTVWLEPLPENAITSVATKVWASLDGFDVVVETEHPTDVTVAIEVPEGSTSVAGRSGSALPVRLTKPRPWSPEDPFLYRIISRTIDDEVESWMGLRTVDLGPIPGAPNQRHAVRLNGRPILLNGVLDQGYWPETGMTPPSDAALAYDLETMRGLGFNMVRKHIKVESRRLYHLADRLGMLVVQDAVSGGQPRVPMRGSALVIALDYHRKDTTSRALAAAGRGMPANRAEFEADLLAMVDLLRQHPSVIAWVIFNEAWGQFETNRIERILRRHDPTRLIDAASGWFDQGGGDFRSRHRYVLRLARPPRRDRRPYFVSEYGGLNLAVPGHLFSTSERFGYRFFDSGDELDAALAKLYREQLIPLVAHGLRAAVYTQLSDVEIETNGLLTYDRRVLKVDANRLRALNEEFETAFRQLAKGHDDHA